jgi:hypothetical protein
MDVRPPLVAYAQPPSVGKPGQRPLHHPAVPTQPLARIDASPGYARLYAPLPERVSAAGEIVALIGMDLIRPPSWYSARGPDRFDALYEPLEDTGAVDVGTGQDHRERQTLTVDQETALGARPTSVYRVRTGLLAPFFAGTQAESNDARDQSMRPSLPSLSSRARRSACHTSLRCQSRSRRQQVTQLHPNSLGSICQGMPLFRTEIMPAKARSGTSGLPPSGLSGSGGSNVQRRSPCHGMHRAHHASARCVDAITPNCCIIPNWSTSTRSSTILPSERQIMSMPDTVTSLPLGAIP